MDSILVSYHFEGFTSVATIVKWKWNLFSILEVECDEKTINCCWRTHLLICSLIQILCFSVTLTAINKLMQNPIVGKCLYLVILLKNLGSGALSYTSYAFIFFILFNGKGINVLCMEVPECSFLTKIDETSSIF